MDNILKSALELAGRGIANFPCNNKKRPTCPHGFKAASVDAEQLRALLRDFPGDLIGVPTGTVNGFDLLDIDLVKHKKAKDWWIANRRKIPRTRIHQSRSGGLHVLFKHDDRAVSRNGWIETGVDVKAAGGYLIWWPAHGCPVLCDAGFSEWPEWLIAEQQPDPSSPFRPIRMTRSGSVESLIRFTESLSEGERNAGTHWAACRVWERDGSDEDLEAIVHAAMQAGLPRTEAERVVFRQARKSVKGMTK